MTSRDRLEPIYYCGGCGDQLQETEPNKHECLDCGVTVTDKKKQVIYQ